jgi:hypothetical protein
MVVQKSERVPEGGKVCMRRILVPALVSALLIAGIAAFSDAADSNTTTRSSKDPGSAAVPQKLPAEYEEQFKDVKAASKIPAEGASASCEELKKGLNEDFDKIMQTLRGLNEERKKKKGKPGVIETTKGMWALKSIVWVAYRMVTGPEQCMKEFEQENKQRFEATTKEIEEMTKEINENNGPEKAPAPSR